MSRADLSYYRPNLANPAMVFAIFNQRTGRIMGTARGRNRVEAMGVVRRHLDTLGIHTSQDVLLYPMMNLQPYQRMVAEQEAKFQ